jgi:hypothetical protein
VRGEEQVADTSFEDERKPIGAVLPGLGIHPLEDGDEAIEAFVLIKVRSAEGEVSWSYRTTGAPNKEEMLGVFTVQADLLRHELVSEWE